MQAASESPSLKCECGSSKFVDRDGFRWCLGCGAGTPLYNTPRRVPGHGADTHYAPTNELCFGRDLGNPGVSSARNGVALLQVLGKHNKKNLGIRAIQVRGECMRSQEAPISQRMLNYGGDLSKRFGYRDQVLFANALGRNLKWIATILTMQNDGTHSKDFAVATFLLNVKKFFGEQKAVQIMEAVWGKEKNGKVIVFDSKRNFILKAKSLIELDRLIL